MAYRHTYVEVDLKNLRENFIALKDLLEPTTFFCPMVKANAYGHGDIEVARVLEELKTPAMGVVLVEEGLRLRGAGIKGPILVFGHFDPDSAAATVSGGLTPVLSHWEHLKALERIVPENTRYPVHVKFNTGMNRLGFDGRDAAELVRYLKGQSRLELEGLCSHFLNGADALIENGRTEDQLQEFQEIHRYFQGLPIQTHFQNSASLLRQLDKKLGARPGLALYGMVPDHLNSLPIGLKPVMSMRTNILFTREVRKGRTVSYGGTWVAPKDSVIAVLPVGYADGYPRALSNKAYVLVRGRRAPVVGRVCMDYTMIDVTEIVQKGSMNPNEDVTLFGSDKGQELGASTLADLCETIPYEITTRIGPRVLRIYKNQ